MRVLLVSHHALPHVGGLEVLVDTEARTLAHLGHEVVHVTSDATGAAGAEAYPSGARRVRVRSWHPIERHLHLAYPLFSPRLVPTLWRETRRADVVHAHGFIYLSSLVAIVIAALQRKPRILTDHGGIQRYHTPVATAGVRLAAMTIGRLTCRLATRLIANNTRVLDLLRRLNGGRAESRFVPYPIDTSLFAPTTSDRRAELRRGFGWTPDRKVVLFVGRLNPDKGADLLVRAGDGAVFDTVICGPGDVGILGDLSARPDVTVLPPRPRSEVPDLYHAADLVAVPTVPGREGFPLVVREALACGTPVVLVDEPGYAPYHGLPGLTFCDRDVASLRAALVRALREPARFDGAHDDALSPTNEQYLANIYGAMGPGVS